MPAGTVTGLPLRRMVRCTWRCRGGRSSTRHGTPSTTWPCFRSRTEVLTCAVVLTGACVPHATLTAAARAASRARTSLRAEVDLRLAPAGVLGAHENDQANGRRQRHVERGVPGRVDRDVRRPDGRLPNIDRVGARPDLTSVTDHAPTT